MTKNKKTVGSDQSSVISSPVLPPRPSEGRGATRPYRVTAETGAIYLKDEDRYPEHDEILPLTDEQAEILLAAGLVESVLPGRDDPAPIHNYEEN